MWDFTSIYNTENGSLFASIMTAYIDDPTESIERLN